MSCSPTPLVSFLLLIVVFSCTNGSLYTRSNIFLAPRVRGGGRGIVNTLRGGGYEIASNNGDSSAKNDADGDETQSDNYGDDDDDGGVGGGGDCSGKSDMESEGDEDGDSDDDDVSSSISTPASTTPFTVKISSPPLHPAFDISHSTSLRRSKTVGELKSQLSNQLKGGPIPVSFVNVKRKFGKDEFLGDNVRLEALLNDESGSDDDDEDENEDEDDSRETLKLTVDMIPPIVPKFAENFPQKRMGLSSLLSAYAKNQAILVLLLTKKNPKTTGWVDIDRKAKRIEELLRLSLGEELWKKLEDEPEWDGEDIFEQENALADIQKTKSRSRNTSNKLKQTLQTNLNIDWVDSIRASVLFLFFGLFGAVSPEARIFLITMSPLTFVCQLRPVKVWARKLFYSSVRPRGILKTLLPVTTQTIIEWNDRSKGISYRDVDQLEALFPDASDGERDDKRDCGSDFESDDG